jgi:hypothetical protein
LKVAIDFDDSQVARLDAWAKASKVSRTEAVRRAVDQMLERNAPPIGTGFGLWAKAAVSPERDGLTLQKEQRDEWPE